MNQSKVERTEENVEHGKVAQQDQDRHLSITD